MPSEKRMWMYETNRLWFDGRLFEFSFGHLLIPVFLMSECLETPLRLVDPFTARCDLLIQFDMCCMLLTPQLSNHFDYSVDLRTPLCRSLFWLMWRKMAPNSGLVSDSDCRSTKYCRDRNDQLEAFQSNV